MASEYAERMAAVVRSIAPALRSSGFRKQRNVFNRDVDDGVVQVIGFQMAPHMPPGTPEVPGLREDLYGSFTVNLGLFFDEVHAFNAESPRPKFLRDYDCHVRQRIGELLSDPADTWWRLDRPDDELIRLVSELIATYALPFLDRFSSREMLLNAWHAGDRFISDAGRAPPFTIALIHAARGEHSAAANIIAADLATPQHPSRAQALRNAATKLGLNLSNAP